MSEKVKSRLKWVKAFFFIVVALMVLYLLIWLFAPHQLQRMGTVLKRKLGGTPKKTVVIATAERGGHYYRLGNLLKKELLKQQHVQMNVQITKGTLDNIQRVKSGEADLAFVQGALQEGKQVDLRGLKAIATIGWQYVHIVAPKTSPIFRFKDLTGKKVSLGPEQSGNAALGKLVMNYFPNHLNVRCLHTEVDVPTIQKDFRNGKMDAIFLVYDLHAQLMEQLLMEGNYRLVPIPEAEALAYTIPGCFSAWLPHSIYGPLRNVPPLDAGRFPTLKVNTLLITRAGMNRLVVQSVLHTLYSTRFIKLSRLPDLDETKGRIVFDLPLHPAADRYYRRNDPVTSDKYEIGSAFLAALIFIASILGYINNRYKLRQLAEKKQRIIPYFEELLSYSQKMSQVETPEELKELLDRMMAMQRRAENKWLTGDLDTEHMENLYSIYGIRCDNAFHKMTLLQLIKQYRMLETSIRSLNQNQSSDNEPPKTD